MNYLVDSFRRIVETPSPVGFYSLLNPVLEKEAARFGYEVTYDRRGTPYIILEGQDNSKSILVGAHSDTVGFVIRRIDPNGMIRVRNVGGINYASCEGETVTIHTRDGRRYTGLFACQSHSVHVFDDAKTLVRDENTCMVILDEPVKSKVSSTAISSPWSPGCS